MIKISDELFSHSSYKTPKKSISKFVQRFPNIGYIAILWIIIKGGIKAYLKKYTAESWVQSSKEIFEVLEDIGCQFEIEGLDYLHHNSTPCIIVGNHMSTLETFVLPSIIQPYKPVTFIVKKSLINYPFFGKLLSSRNPIIIDRKNPKEDFIKVVKEGTKHLNNGTSLIIFPQSTRSSTFLPEKFNSIGVKLARHTGFPIIPLALKTDAWSEGTFIKDFGSINPQKTIHFSFNSPIYVSGAGKDEHKKIILFIKKKINEWNNVKNVP